MRYQDGIEANIPNALKQQPNWVCWTWSNCKKLPVRPDTLRAAAIDDPSSWVSFDAALSQWKAGGVEGVSFALTSATGMVAVDLDDCRDVQTGVLTLFAQEVLSLLPSYSEVSPSGRGVHTFVRGTLPGERRRTVTTAGRIELYPDGRFMTVTGVLLPGCPRAIQEHTSGLSELYLKLFPKPVIPAAVRSKPNKLDDDEILARAQRAKDGTTFSGLFYAGDTGLCGGDWSAADFRLCQILSRYSSDPAQIDRLFRRSPLARREKWERKLGGSTYGLRTIERALRPY